MNLEKELKKIIKGEVDISKSTLEEHSTDASIFKVKPKVVVFPKDVEDVKEVINFVKNNKDKDVNLSVTFRSAGTDMTGGPLNESIILNFTKYINKIDEVFQNKETAFIKAQPGAYYRDFEKKTLKQGYLMPSFPASKDICAMGGIVSNNSGGEKTLKYGKTEKYVKEVKMVLSDGNEYEFRPLSKQQLEKKINQNDFEGNIYKNTFSLVKENYDLLQSVKPKVSKNSAGYSLWNIWNKESDIFDLTQLFVGSQGTLGALTEAKFELVKPKEHKKLLVIFMKDINSLSSLINKVLLFEPESFESYDDKTLKLVLKYFFSFVKMLGIKNLIKLLWSFRPEAKMTLKIGFPKLILLAEFTGDTEDEVIEKAKEAQKSIKNFKGIKTHLVKSELEAKKYWTIRRETFNLIRHHLKGDIRSEPFIEDVIVSPDKLPEFFPALYKILDSYKDKMTYALGGHAGDGNIHIYSLMNPKDKDTKNIIKECSEKVYDLVLRLGGSITAEHSDGLIRSPYLEKMYGKEVVELFQKIKQIFDPKNIFNPGKKTNSDFEYSLNHLKDN
ncbi:MAG: FAD-binding oxidoreductase [Candidatus Paceibacterota bacterium]